MTIRHAAVLGSNLVLLVATGIAFGTWIEHGLGYFEYDFVGLTWHAWAPLVVLATLLAWLGVGFVWARIAGWAALAALGFIVIDHAVGALRDGEVSPPGALLGALMVGQVVVLGASLTIAGSARASVVRRVSIGLLTLAGLLVVTGSVASVQFAGAGPKEDAVGRWLDDLAGGSADRGWSFLDEVARSRTSFEKYRADAGSVDWNAVHLSISAVDRLGSNQWHVSVMVEGGLDGVPAFLLDDRIVQPDCFQTPGAGFIVYVETPYFAAPRIGPGRWSDTTERAADDQACPSPEPMPTPAVRWDEGESWTGFTLEAWNRTTLDLYLEDRNGRRVGLPACGRASTSLLDLTQFEIRAAGGYVGTIGMGTLDTERTQFVVVLAESPEVNGAPPAEPLPPCEGRPQVQPGV